MNKLFSAALYISAFVFSAASIAETPSQVPNAIALKPTQSFDAKKLEVTLGTTLGIKVISAKKTPMPGLAEVHTDQGLFYTSYDGTYFIQGKLFKLGANVSNLTELSLAEMRVNGFKDFEKDMIVYPAKNEEHVVTVFTDYTCTYCRKLHNKMDEYNNLGITVRYMPYPRYGIYEQDNPQAYTENFKNLRSIWCHEDPNTAMTKAKASSGRGIANRICDTPIEESFNFARQVGVSSTPAIVLANGFMMPGFREPVQLKAILDTM